MTSLLFRFRGGLVTKESASNVADSDSASDTTWKRERPACLSEKGKDFARDLPISFHFMVAQRQNWRQSAWSEFTFRYREASDKIHIITPHVGIAFHDAFFCPCKIMATYIHHCAVTVRAFAETVPYTRSIVIYEGSTEYRAA